jgi:plastocyanin
MKKTIGSAAVLSAILIFSGCGYSAGTNPSNSMPANTPPPSPQGTTSTAPSNNSATAVSIQNFAFNPGTLTVTKGATVTWTNNDSVPHQIKSATFNSSPLSQGQTFSFTFNDAGSFDYSCAIHPSMLGKIVVQ